MSDETIDIVVGASCGIGHAMAKQLLEQGRNVVATARQGDQSEGLNALAKLGAVIYPLDMTDDESIEHFKQAMLDYGRPLSYVINSAGVLHDESMQPEKQSRDINREQLIKSFDTNAFGHALLLVALEPLIRKSTSCLCVSISARVGSISDNQLGGWYAYRASKSALNMLIKNLAIEYKRKYKDKVTLAVLHPGTTDTRLSEPFQTRMKYVLHTPDETASNLLNVMKSIKPEQSGCFLDHKGKAVPW